MVNNQNIRVSVVMPVYNVSLFVREAIQSVLDQSLQEIELILVNDGSTDGSATICEDFCSKDNRIVYLSKQNEGVSIARNLGLAHVRGEYVFFMDADDTIDKDFLKTTYAIGEKEKSDIVVIGEYYYKRLLHVKALATWALMIKVDFLQQYADIRFPPHIQPCEDGLFTHQLLLMADRISFNRESVYHYRHHDAQNHLTNNNRNDVVLEQIPTWFKVLDDFYSRYRLQKSKAIELALFIEHEPFEFRYVGMQWTNAQKSYLFDLIHDYLEAKVLPYLSAQDKKRLSPLFVMFIHAKRYTDFEDFRDKRERTGHFYLKLAKLIPLRGVKRKIIRKINKHYFA